MEVQPDPVTITPYADGPLIVRGPVQILDSAGQEIDPGRATIALFRCGRSARKPFCDGSHTAVAFRATGGDERARRALLAAADPARAVRSDPQPRPGVSDTATEDELT